MDPLLTSMIMLGALATVVVLFRGIGSMAHGGSYGDVRSDHLMFARVVLQAVTVVLILLAALRVL